MKPQTGLLLRMLGPLLEIVCAAILMKTWGARYSVLGVKLETILMMGFFVGLMMVVAGLTLARRPGRRRKVADLDLNLDRESP